ncbi:MAG: 23S rRNA (guanosine(2251)-2'-O)-methyltransferase RlmB [Chloroflexi bacterium]|nr:23S rRNA (guanosine(2251)-2'-O)-methyltransferase RlmB [Chloroflexota bacterium]
MREFLYGRNAVYETLRAARRGAHRLLAAQGAEEKGRLGEILRTCQERHIPVERVARARLDKISPHAQGVALEAEAYPYSALPDMFDLARERGEPLFLLILDTLQDPQNLGTLLRTAEIVGIHGVLLPLRHTVSVTPAVVNASSGASERLLIAQANLAQSLERIKEAGAWVIGLEGSPQALPPGKVRLDGPLALVVGSEGEGMRPLVRASCDLTMRLPMRGQVASLNAAVAGSVALYLAWQARGGEDWTA